LAISRARRSRADRRETIGEHDDCENVPTTMRYERVEAFLDLTTRRRVLIETWRKIYYNNNNNNNNNKND